MAETIRLGVTVDTDTRATRKEFADLRREVKREAEGMGDDWEAAAQKVEESLIEAGARDDLIEAARRIGRDGPNEIERMQRALRDVRDASDDAAASARDFGDTATDGFGDAGDAAMRAGDDVKDGLEGPLTATQDMMNEVKSSLTESMGELAGSFAENGFNMEDSIDGVVEVAAEAAGALPGPWSLAGAAMVAVAAGTYGEWKKRMDQIAEEASAMYQDMLESGADFISDSYFQSKLQEFFDPMGESYDDNMKKIDVLTDLGVPVDEAARALVGYGDEADRSLSLAKERMEEYRGTTSLLDDDFGALASGAVQDLGDVITSIEDSKKSTDTARSAVNSYRDSIEEIPGAVDTDVDVDDRGSVRATQDEIDRIHGNDVRIQASVDTSSAEATLDAFRWRWQNNAVTVPFRAGQAPGNGFFFYP